MCGNKLKCLFWLSVELLKRLCVGGVMNVMWLGDGIMMRCLLLGVETLR